MRQTAPSARPVCVLVNATVGVLRTAWDERPDTRHTRGNVGTGSAGPSLSAEWR